MPDAPDRRPQTTPVDAVAAEDDVTGPGVTRGDAHRRPDDRSPFARPPWFLRVSGLTLLFFVAGATWALASPLFSIPDEPAHAVKAAAVWQGQLRGPAVIQEDGVAGLAMQVPGTWAQASVYPRCFAFHPDVTANCAPEFETVSELTEVSTSAGNYPPLYYALIGWGGRLLPNSTGVYLMRVVSALFSALFLALSVRALSTIVAPKWALLGVLTAATPMVYFLGGSINPNGFEVATAIATWCSALAIIGHTNRSSTPVPAALAYSMAVSGIALTFTRSLSPLFLVGIVVATLLAATPGSLRVLAKDQRVRRVGLGLLVATIISTTMIVVSGHLGSVPGQPLRADQTPLHLLIGNTDTYIDQMIAVFGWLDTGTAELTFYLWIGIIAALSLLSFASASLRRNVPLALTLVGTILMPIVVQLPRVTTEGAAWQGRYTLPLAVGIPLLAVFVLPTSMGMPVAFGRRFTALSVGLLGVGNVYAMYWALRRYGVGNRGGVNIISDAWQPPLGMIAEMAAMIAFAVACVVAVIRAPDHAFPAMQRRRRSSSAEPTTEPTTEPDRAPP